MKTKYYTIFFMNGCDKLLLKREGNKFEAIKWKFRGKWLDADDSWIDIIKDAKTLKELSKNFNFQGNNKIEEITEEDVFMELL